MMARQHLDDAHLFEAGNLREFVAVAATVHHEYVDDDDVPFLVKQSERQLRP